MDIGYLYNDGMLEDIKYLTNEYLANKINIEILSSKIEKEKDISVIEWCISNIFHCVKQQD